MVQTFAIFVRKSSPVTGHRLELMNEEQIVIGI